MSSLYILLQDQLNQAQKEESKLKARNSKGAKIQTPKTGKAITNAYEQFRNAAEYAEEHLLLERAIRRFFVRSIFLNQPDLENIGEEIVVELTHAGYIENNSVSTETADYIQKLAEKYYGVYKNLRKSRIDKDTAENWVLDLLSVETESQFSPHGRVAAVAYTAYAYYLKLLPKKKLRLTRKEHQRFELSLFIAIHLAILKSDTAIIRHQLYQMHGQNSAKTREFIEFNRSLDAVISDGFTHRLKRVVSRYGAPWRILKEMAEERSDMGNLLKDKEVFMTGYQQQVTQEYRRIKKRLSLGITKSVIFLFMTKVFIGLAIEIPYDLWVLGHIAYLPLVINLLFPPLYIASLGFVIRMPTQANARALNNSMEQILFSEDVPSYGKIKLGPRYLSPTAQLAYAALFMIPLWIIVVILSLLGFNIMQGLIFFVFLSTASFLGFRLSKIVREMELIIKQNGFLTAIADFFYIPFIIIGQWLTRKYAKLNLAGAFLDMAIELPLKSFIRLIRQWTRFINERRDEIY